MTESDVMTEPEVTPVPDMPVPDVPVPDVTVIVSVFNTMPYLTACLDSLVNQTIGLDRMEVITVDDGSTDGSSEELKRYADAHPQTFTVIRQPNSGGPASPCNRGLDVATGRYVFFLGADDYLGIEALERLVSKGDEWESDVIFGRIEGVNGRFVDQRIFAKTERNLNFTDFPLAYALSNTKLFRRSLIEKHKIRYALDLRVGSDQPFVIEALLGARRISVLGDYTYCFGVKRTEGSNITYALGWRDRLDGLRAIVGHIADVVEPGALRDAILGRHFTWEVSKLVRNELPKLKGKNQLALADAIRQLADEYFTDGISRQLGVQARIRLRLVQAGELDMFNRVFKYQQENPQSPMVLRQDRAYSWLPGFEDPAKSFPAEWFEITTENTWDRLVRGIASSNISLDRGRLNLGGQIGVTADSEPHVRVALLELSDEEPPPPNRRFAPGDVPAAVEFPVSLVRLDPGGPSGLSTIVPLDPTVLTPSDKNEKWSVRLRVDVGQWTYDLPVRSKNQFQTSTAQHRLRGYRIVAWSGPKEFLVVRSEQASSGAGIPRIPLPMTRKRA